MVIRCVFLVSLFYITLAIETIEDEYLKKGCLTNLRLQQLDADYIVAGFFPTHVLDGGKYKRNAGAITWTLAMVYAIEQINKNETLLPGIKLGYDIRDTCNENDLAVHYLLELMLSPEYMRPKLDSNNKKDICIARNNSYSIIAGVIGGATSSISSIINNVISSDFIPQVSYSATSASLSNRETYRSFSRTVPSDVYQADAIAELLAYFGWTYVSAFASDNEYGRLGLDELRISTKKRNICLAADKTFEPVLTDKGLNDIMDHLLEFKHTSHVVILWCQRPNAIKIINATENLGLVNITWIGTETWGTTTKLFDILSGNIIGLELDKPPVPGFLDSLHGKLDSFKPSTSSNCKNPWFKAYTHKYIPFACEFAKFVSKLLPTKKYPQVIASVYALAHSLHKTLNCSNSRNCTKNKKLDYEAIYENIKRLNFTVPTSKYRIIFDDEGESVIKSYQIKFWNKMLKNGRFFSHVGHWNGRGTLKVNESELFWGKQGKPAAHCSAKCIPGYYRINSSSKCCWSCAKCAVNTISTIYNQAKCKKCHVNQVANFNQTSCMHLRKLHLAFDSQIGITIIVLSCVGVILTAFILFIFFWYWDTPMIKSSSREMSCLQLASLLLLFCLPALYMLKLSVFVCSLRLYVFGFLFTTVVAIILTKTYRLLRVFSERFTKVSRFLHNKYQIFFSYAIVLLQVLLTVLWFSNFPPVVANIIDKESETIYTECGYQETVVLWFILGYVFVLALASGYMAFRARKLPENFNETQYICFAMFTACVLWVSFIPLYVSLNAVGRTVAFLAINFACMLCILLVLYGYKIGIILFYPQLNSPEHFRKTATKATVAHFRRDSEGKTMYQSVVMFDIMDSKDRTYSTPTRRCTIGSTEQLSQLDDVIEMDGLVNVSVRRRASFGGMGEKENIAKEHIIPIDMLQTRMNKMKKSQSTPLLCDGESFSFSPRGMRPVSQFMGQLVSATSLNRIFTDRKFKTSVELKGLLLDETQL